MTNTLNILDVFWQAVEGATVGSMISGNVYKHQRPFNSQKEDIVLTCLPVTDGTIQRAVVNVNIYVPNLELSIDNQTDSSQPDHERLQELTTYLMQDLQEVYNSNDNFYIESQSVLKEESINYHFVNIRFGYNFIN